MRTEKTCKNCSHKNSINVRYCQRCGSPLPSQNPIRQYFSSLDFRWLAGRGEKEINFAPLFTAPKSNNIQTHTTANVDPLPNGTWYCPDCGTLNATQDRICKNCAKSR